MFFERQMNGIFQFNVIIFFSCFCEVVEATRTDNREASFLGILKELFLLFFFSFLLIFQFHVEPYRWGNFDSVICLVLENVFPT